MPRFGLAVSLLLLVGCAGSTSTPASASFADVWAGLDVGAASLTGEGGDVTAVCDPPFATWFADFGVRGLACVAAQTVSPVALVARAPVDPFRSGPHVASRAAVDLDLATDRAFGHYDPAFVEWLAKAAVPTGPAAVLAAPVYRRHVARLARVYWLTHADLTADGFPASTPAGPLAAYARYLDGGPVPDGMGAYDTADGFSVFAFTDRSERLLGDIGLPVGNEWTAKYEANTAYGFWLRRRQDGTHGEWRDALRGLLRAYDAEWLVQHGG
ncbi:hypothetical protein [Rubrivirga sp. IMCC43871]|uniref:hypothetical protein n=1 Tax=Rubrivirga sp. IMCC43871 TaxID=3391575 RepID=UPI00398F90C6